jgi:hypothetical protein
LLDSLYPARMCSNIGHWPSYHLAWDGQALVQFSWKTWCAWLSEHPDYTAQCSSLVKFGRTIQHSVISTEGRMNEYMTRQPLKCS